MNHLEANAQSLASQAISYIVPNMQLVPLADLVRSFSFLNDVRIRIMDSTKHLVLDTGGIKNPEDAIWAVLIPDGSATNMRPITGRLSESDARSLATLESRKASSSGEESQKASERFVWHINKYILPSGTMLDIQSPGGFPSTKTAGEPYISDSDGGTVKSSRTEPSLAGKQKKISPVIKFFSIVSLKTVTAVHEMVDAKGWVVGYVELNYEMNPFRAVVNYAQLAFLFAAAVAVVLVIPIGIISSRRITTPLMHLSDVAIRMSSGDFSVRAIIKDKDEIGILAEKFNQMAYRIEKLFRQSNEDRDTLRRFISDASHELRTPLSALANSIELLQNAASSDPLARMKFLKICESQVQ
ncbi:MAG: HAMP domain-containing protein, partial [Rectinemataceae bacterium]|nr:HAMP domain-containing protein [Rectinemataceae bacterium]